MRSSSRGLGSVSPSGPTSHGGGSGSQPARSSPRRRKGAKPGLSSSGAGGGALTALDILENLPGGVIALDEAGRITFVNFTVERLLGVARAELTGRDLREAYPAAFSVPLFERYQRALREREPQTLALFFPPRALWLEARINLVDDGAVIILTDITERKRLENERALSLQRERALRKLAEIARARSQRNDLLLRRLMESQLIGIVISDSGRIIEANDVFLTMLGYTREDFPPGGILWESLIPPDAIERNWIAYNQLTATGECAPYETELYRKDASRIPVLLGGVRQRPGEAETVSVIVDLSSHKRLERSLVERASELSATIEAIADSVMLYDAQGNLTTLNQSAREMFGISSVEDYRRIPLSERVRMFDMRLIDGTPIIPEEASIARALYEVSPNGGGPLELILRTLDGREIAIGITIAPIHDMQGRIIGAVVIGRDMTAHQRLERALMESNAQLEEARSEAERRAQQWFTIIETMADGVVVLDREGRITQVNKTMRYMLGISDQPVEAFANRPFEEWRERYDMRDGSGSPFPSPWPIERVLAGERLIASAAVDMLVRAPTGEDVTISVSGAPLRDERSEISGAVFVIRDVTERKAREREQAETLDNVAHELNSPLTTLSLLARFITREERLPPLQVARLNEALTRLTRLSEDLRAAHGLESDNFPLERKRTELRALCAQVVAEQMAQASHEVIALLPEQQIYADIDPVRISQALTNLVSNAIKYGPSDLPVTVRLMEVDGAARIEIHDEGPGIPLEVQRRLFERFFRAPDIKRHFSGIGLGLYISRRLVELHGGRMGVESAPGHGTTFWLMLPLQEAWASLY
jgi:PAS domain S-box-containing protein